MFKFGLIGAAAGTLVAMFYHTCYFVWYLQKHILERPAKHFICYMLIDCLTATVSAFLTRGFALGADSYLAWVVLALKVACEIAVVTLVIHVIFYRNQMKTLIRLFKEIM